VNLAVVRQLLVKHRIPVSTEVEFLRLDERRVIHYLQLHLRPVNVPDFISALKRTARFSRTSAAELSLATFDEFYLNLISHTQLFNKVFRFLAQNNLPNVPVVDDHEIGLIHTYLLALPGDFAKKLMTQIRATQSSYIQSFFSDRFMPVVDDIARRVKFIRKIAEYFGPLDQAFARERRAPAPNTPATAADSVNPTGFQRKLPFFARKNTPSLNHLVKAGKRNLAYVADPEEEEQEELPASLRAPNERPRLRRGRQSP
jgi:hypothetical protein